MFPFQFVCDRIQITQSSIVKTTWLPILTLDALSRDYLSKQKEMKGAISNLDGSL